MPDLKITTADHGLARDVAHAAGLAITEATGNGAPVLTHAPSLRAERRGTDGRICVVIDLYLPTADAWGDRLEILNVAVTEVVTGVDPLYRGGFVACRDKGARQILTVAVPRDAATRSVWERRASRKIRLDRPMRTEWDDDTFPCHECGKPLSQDAGEVFITDDGHTWCNDHYPNRPNH